MTDIKKALLGDHEAAKLTHLSLFSGIGGLDLASEMAGFRTVGQCEWADYPTKVLEKHWPDVPRWRDIRTLTGESFYEKTGMRTVNVISGGFPCQPFSVAGKRRGKEDDRYLWPEMLRVISELRPDWVVGENVAGIVNMALNQVYADLENEGYTVGEQIGIPRPEKEQSERCCDVLSDTDHRSGTMWRNWELSAVEEVAGGRADHGGRAPEYVTGEWWPTEPNVGRVAHGVPSRVDRLKCLGNAVVPQQFYPIFQAIADIEKGIIHG